MQCPSCNTELPKKAKICPKCGTAVGKPKGNIKLMAIIGLIIMLIASLLPLVQSGEKIKEGVYPTAYAFSYMNISMPVLWYLFIMISFRKKKNLRLLFQPSESFTMKNPVTISLKSRSDITRFLFSFPSLRVFA